MGSGVKQGDPAGPLFFAVSIFELFESIRDAVEKKLVAAQFPLMPSYVGVTAVCDDLKFTCDPQLALPVAEVVQRKMAEASRGLNLTKCRILIHSDSADLVVWPSTLPPPTYPLLLVVSMGINEVAGDAYWPRDFSPEIFCKLAYTRSLPRYRAWRSWRPGLPRVCCEIVLMNALIIWSKTL